MRQIPNQLREAEALQYRPARWVQTIATDFFSRKSCPLENERAQTSEGTKRCTARSGWSPADNCDIKNFHRRLIAQKVAKTTKVFVFDADSLFSLFPSVYNLSAVRLRQHWRAIQ